jgi:hypothetical protein
VEFSYFRCVLETVEFSQISFLHKASIAQRIKEKKELIVIFIATGVCILYSCGLPYQEGTNELWQYWTFALMI